MVLEVSGGCYYLVSGTESICHNLLNLTKDVATEIYFEVRVEFG